MDAREAATRMAFDVAIATYNTDHYLLRLLRSLGTVLPAAHLNAVHVWDNHSTDTTLAMLAAFAPRDPRIQVHLAATNIHHGPALDRLLREHCTSDWVLVLDADTEVLRNFVPDLPDLFRGDLAFVGQMNPLGHQLYAYLAHVLVHRPTYLALPPFRDDGAPADEYFRAVSDRHMPYARFRWCDYIAHAGQASLRALHARGEIDHPLYAFANAQITATPSSPARIAHEARLRDELQAFLAQPVEGLNIDAFARAHAVSTSQAASQTLPRKRSATVVAVDTLRTIASPVVARHLHRAQRVGLMQRPGEIRGLFEQVHRLRPQRVLEVGTAYGGSLFLWTRAAANGALLVSVDLPPWELDDPWEPEKIAEFRRFARRDQTIELIRASSHAALTVAAVRSAMNGQLFDFVFIDGDSSHDGAAQDVEAFLPLVRAGGLVALHNIHPHSRGWGGDVPRLWRELRKRHRTEELIADQAQNGHGIGLLWV